MVRTSSGVSWVGVVRGQLLTSSSWHARSGRFHAWYREGERPSTRSDHRERQARPRSGDCSQELRLGGAVWDTGLVQADSGEADQREEKPRDRANHLVALPQPQNLGLEGDRLFGDDVQRDDGARTAPKPADRGRPRHAHPLEQVRVAFLAGQSAKAMVVGLSAVGHGHQASPKSRRPHKSGGPGSGLISGLLQLRQPNSRMSWCAAGKRSMA